ncbi:MAG: Two-component response regulator [Candidatus Collierbacteria bacterium GW2011_GWC2_44_18]|uniref:Two-component response regulator n=1 Tax=Candidatus Collierbacteria bacterium GW2011_GWC2_44_18 TaxID=1618392 RepID=A0A0G1KNK3_9BACT|nr:MAG: Two-component response regulator [candidate division CPR2 bacterium GW2011_GWC1_39_9]KKT49549.1 MAG: Two-component response regulator [Candidatus Collierbacteria bacterium GW2011_GWC2_44_18]
MEVIKKFYNKNIREVSKQNGGITARRSKIIGDWINTSKVILDVGCNDGSENKYLLGQGKKIFGIDISVQAVKRAVAGGIIAKVCDISTEKIPFPKNKFDCVIAGEIIEHIIDTDDFLLKLRSVLKPKGILVVTTPNLASLGRRLLLLLGKNPFIETSLKQKIWGSTPVGHLRYFTAESLKSLIEANGFLVQEITSDYLAMGPVVSAYLGRLFPTLGWRLILKAKKR